MNELILCRIFVGFWNFLIKLAGEKIYLIKNLVTSYFEKLRLQEKGFFLFCEFVLWRQFNGNDLVTFSFLEANADHSENLNPIKS